MENVFKVFILQQFENDSTGYILVLPTMHQVDNPEIQSSDLWFNDKESALSFITSSNVPNAVILEVYNHQPNKE